MENGLFLAPFPSHTECRCLSNSDFFDVLIGVLIMGILIFRINKTFESIDTDTLKTLIG